MKQLLVCKCVVVASGLGRLYKAFGRGDRPIIAHSPSVSTMEKGRIAVLVALDVGLLFVFVGGAVHRALVGSGGAHGRVVERTGDGITVHRALISA